MTRKDTMEGRKEMMGQELQLGILYQQGSQEVLFGVAYLLTLVILPRLDLYR